MKKMKEQEKMIRAVLAENARVTRQFHIIQNRMGELMRLMQRVVVSPKAQGKNMIQSLSLRERQIFELIGKKKTEPQIGGVLGINRKTVNNLKNRMAKKLGLSSARDLKLLVAHKNPTKRNKK